VQFESGVRAQVGDAFTFVLEFAKAVCLLLFMFRVDAKMRPLLMTFESRRVTLNDGDANFSLQQ
jgi:hypothetical protein